MFAGETLIDYTSLSSLYNFEKIWPYKFDLF